MKGSHGIVLFFLVFNWGCFNGGASPNRNKRMISSQKKVIPKIEVKISSGHRTTNYLFQKMGSNGKVSYHQNGSLLGEAPLTLKDFWFMKNRLQNFKGNSWGRCKVGKVDIRSISSSGAKKRTKICLENASGKKFQELMKLVHLYMSL